MPLAVIWSILYSAAATRSMSPPGFQIRSSLPIAYCQLDGIDEAVVDGLRLVRRRVST
jgi:hypothetical protein